MTNDDGSDLYDANYYEHHCGDRAYTPDDPAWPAFFGSVADRIVSDIRPKTVLDVGCAFGFLVAALRDRHIDAKGFDFSSYAISQAPSVSDNLEGNVWVASATEPIEGHYDLITSIEVIEHLSDADGRKALKNITDACDRFLLSSTPLDFTEPTHINVRPVDYWAELLAELGFYRDLNVDTDFVTPWAGLFVRGNPTKRELVRNYERERGPLSIERGDLRRENQRLNGALAANSAVSSVGGQVRDSDATQKALAEARDAVLEARNELVGVQAEAAEAKANLHLHLTELESLKIYRDQIEDRVLDIQRRATEGDLATAELAAVKNSTSWRLMWIALSPYRRLKSALLGHG